MNRRGFLALSASGAALAACAPVIQQAGLPGPTFGGPRIADDVIVSFDGARLGLQHWAPADGAEPWAVIIGLHGMNDYSQAFHLAAPWWADRGVATYAYDQRGFGRSPKRGVWGGALMLRDLQAVAALARARHPNAIVAVVGESMGAAVALAAGAQPDPPDIDRLVLVSPAVWGWSTQPLPNSTSLWLLAHVAGPHVLNPPDWLYRKITATDNREELIRMGRDPQMIWGARIDTTYGLVGLMETAYRSVGKAGVPTAFLYGAHDQIIPKTAAFPAAQRLKGGDVSAYYPDGYHLLLVDHAAERVWGDILGFLKDPKAPLPSRPMPVPARESKARRSAGARRASGPAAG